MKIFNASKYKVADCLLHLKKNIAESEKHGAALIYEDSLICYIERGGDNDFLNKIYQEIKKDENWESFIVNNLKEK